MKMFRLIDSIAQSALILAGIYFGIKNLISSEDLFFIFYFIVGSWQIVSMLIHYFFIRPTLLYEHRQLYAKTILFVFITGFVVVILSNFIPQVFLFLFLYLYGLLIFAPVLAFFYLYICWKEYSLIVKRELIHLK
jgi:hypothetical protein